MKILLSIKPEFVEQIFSGRKKFEYRKAIFKKDKITSVMVYSTMPVGKIVGEFTIEEVLIDNPQTIWKKTHLFSGITKDFFEAYFAGKKSACAIKIGKTIHYDEPINPYEKWNEFIPPQSFRYINEEIQIKGCKFI